MDKLLKELHDEMEKLIEMCEKAEENQKERYQKVKFEEICKFIKKCFDAQKIKHPKFFRINSKNIRYIYLF